MRNICTYNLSTTSILLNNFIRQVYHSQWLSVLLRNLFIEHRFIISTYCIMYINFITKITHDYFWFIISNPHTVTFYSNTWQNICSTFTFYILIYRDISWLIAYNYISFSGCENLSKLFSLLWCSFLNNFTNLCIFHSIIKHENWIFGNTYHSILRFDISLHNFTQVLLT